jgi:Na+/H+-dicarboxylate symporter
MAGGSPPGRDSTGSGSLTTQVLVGLVLGLAVGVFLAPAEGGWPARVVSWIEPVGGLWVNAIRMTVIPLLVSLLLGGIVSSGAGTVARIGGRTVAWFVTLVAATTALAAVVAPPLLGILGADAVQIPELAGSQAPAEVALPPFRDWFVGLLPANPVAAAAQGEILPLVLFTVVFGLAATRIADHRRALLVKAARAVSDTILVVVEWILATAPVGVFALTLALAARTGPDVVVAVAGLLAVDVLLVVVALAGCYPLVAWLADVPLGRFARACAPPQAVGFSTRSSLASLPVMLEEAERTLRVPGAVSGLVLPGAVSVLKFASPMTRIAGTWFVASLFSVSLGPLEWAAVAAGLGALSFYSPGIPSGGLFVMAPLYQAFGLPMEGIGILIALDLIPDMFLTAANVTGDMAVTALVAGRSSRGRAVESTAEATDSTSA